MASRRSDDGMEGTGDGGGQERGREGAKSHCAGGGVGGGVMAGMWGGGAIVWNSSSSNAQSESCCS